MLAGLTVAIALLGAAAQGPRAPPVKAPEQPAKAAERCSPAPEKVQPGEIVVCAERPQGYRIDPDVLEASRAKRSRRLKRPERMKDTSCASVGPFGCGPGAGVNLIAAALTAAEMASRLAKGEEIGSLFVTEPEPSEYDLYREAKRTREAKEAEAAAKAKAKAAAASRP